jgi:peptidyl-prolyl cis-trans isomerase D
MLEQMRKSSQSLLIYVLFGIVIAVFIINFGPQSQGGGGCDGAMGGDESAARVGGETVSAQAFRSAFMLMGGANQPPQMLKLRRFKESVMDRLIERELLAQEAEQLGFAVSEDDVHKMLLDGRIIGLGIPHTIPRIQRDGVFNYDQFKNFAQFELGLTPDRFVEQQQREMLAAEMRDLLRSSVKVSPEEVKTTFELKNRQINLEYVRFPSRKYEGAVEPTTDEVKAFMKANEAKLKEIFAQRKQMYTDLPAESRAREILIKSKTEGDDTAARKRADTLLARLKKGEAFTNVAREASDDEESRIAGGDLGWRRKGTLGLAEADDPKLFAAKPGEIVGPLKTSQGWVILSTSGQRQGTLTFDQVVTELAEEQIKQEKATGIARQKAEAALALAKAAPDKSLKDLFPGPTDARAEETGLFARRGTVVEQIGDSPEVAKAAFALQPTSPVAGPFEVAGSYVVIRLKERKEPDLAEFAKKRPELQRDAELAKWNDVYTNWVKHRCLQAKRAGKITVNKTVLRYEDSAESPPYDACGGDSPRRSS